MYDQADDVVLPDPRPDGTVIAGVADLPAAARPPRTVSIGSSTWIYGGKNLRVAALLRSRTCCVQVGETPTQAQSADRRDPRGGARPHAAGRAGVDRAGMGRRRARSRAARAGANGAARTLTA